MKNGKSENNFVFHEKQDKVAQMKEYMILGLRKIDGIDIQTFENKSPCKIRAPAPASVPKSFSNFAFDTFEESNR